MKKIRVITVIIYVLLISLAIVTIFPVIYTLLASLKSNMEILTDQGSLFPKEPTLDNYKMLFSMTETFNVPRMLLNSIYYTVGFMGIVLIISALTGYVFARGEFPGKKIVFACFTALMFLKTGGLGIYAVFKVLNLVGINSGLNAILFQTLFAVPIVQIYLVRGYICSIPRELDEAAEIDGCGFVSTFFRIILPLLKPILATIGILLFQQAWNDYITPTIYTANVPEQQTLIVGLMSMRSSSGAATNWNMVLAGSMVALMPVLIIYIVGNKFFVSGISAGAVKG